MSLLKAFHGLHAARARVVFPSGNEASLDLTSGDVRASPKVTRTEDGLTVGIEGSPAVVEIIYSNLRSRHAKLCLPVLRICRPRASPGSPPARPG